MTSVMLITYIAVLTVPQRGFGYLLQSESISHSVVSDSL